VSKKRPQRKRTRVGTSRVGEQKRASGAEPKQHRWRKPLAWSGGVGTAVLIGVLISVLSTQAGRVIPQPSSAAGDTPALQASPKTALTPSAESTRTTSPVRGRPSLNPLTVVSEDPVNVDDLADWAFARPVVLSTAALKTLNHDVVTPTSSGDADLTAIADYMYSRGGYETEFIDTQLVVQNNQNVPLRVIDIGVIKSCTQPLGGMLFFGPGQASDSGVKIGFNLDSTYSYALEIPNNSIVSSESYPYYFANYTVTIAPGAQQVFDLVAQSLDHACTFRYVVTVLEGEKKVYQTIGDGSNPFRVTGYRKGRSAYSVVYEGGAYSPSSNSLFVRVNPRKFDTSALGL
jgi:hypothetical protein